jgi:ElaB/YqjD/DUF883 family membrane-anchored ribosome-binding protein
MEMTMNRHESTTAGSAGKTAEKMVDEAVAGIESTARSAAYQVEKAADAVSRQGREAAEGVQDVAANFGDALEESLRNRPMATVALAAAAGFVIGALWKS